MSDVAPAAPAAAPTNTPQAQQTAQKAPQGEGNPEAQGGNTEATPRQGEGSAAPRESAAQKEAARRLKLKVYGKEREVPETEALAYAQKYLAGEMKLDALSKREKEFTEKEARLKDPQYLWQLLQQAGHNPTELAEAKLREAIEAESLSPQEKRARELEAKLKGYEDMEAQRELQTKHQQHEAEMKHYQNEFSQLFQQTLEATGLPLKSAPAVFPRMARLYETNMAHGIESTPEEMAAEVMEGLKAEHSQVLAKMSLQEKLNWLGDDFLLELRRYDVGRIRQKKSGMTANNNPTPQAPQPPAANDNSSFDRWKWIQENILKGQK